MIRLIFFIALNSAQNTNYIHPHTRTCTHLVGSNSHPTSERFGQGWIAFTLRCSVSCTIHYFFCNIIYELVMMIFRFNISVWSFSLCRSQIPSKKLLYWVIVQSNQFRFWPSLRFWINYMWVMPVKVNLYPLNTFQLNHCKNAIAIKHNKIWNIIFSPYHSFHKMLSTYY